MRAARAVGVPLSVMRGRRRPGRKWSATDRDVMLALQAFEDDLCTCGHPRRYAMDKDTLGHYKVEGATCNACAANDRANEARGDRPPSPGRVQYTRPDDAVLYAMHNPIHVPPLHT